MAIYQNFLPSELKTPKKRSHSAAVFTRLVCLDVRTLGSGVGSLYSMFLFWSVFFWCWGMFVNRWYIFGPCLAHVLDLQWRQVNVVMWSTCFNFVIWIASIKFQKLTPARKDLKFGFLLNYMFIYMWHCSWRYKIWRHMKFMHCLCIFASLWRSLPEVTLS